MTIINLDALEKSTKKIWREVPAGIHADILYAITELRLLREFERQVRNADDSGQRDAEFVAADAEAAIRWLDEQRKAVSDEAK